MVQVLLIAAFMAMFMRDAAPGLWFGRMDGRVVSGVVLGSMAGLWLAAHVVIVVQGRRLDRRGDYRAVRRADLAAAGARLGAAFVHVFAVLGLGWLDVVRRAVGDLIVVDEVLAAAPLLLVFAGTWWSIFPIDRRLREATLIRELDEGRGIRPMPSRGAFVLGALRHQAAIVVVPVIGVLAWYETVERYSPKSGLPVWFPAAVQIAGMVMVLSLMPVVMRRVWDTVALERGELRDLLAGMCRAHGVRVRDLLVWRTQGAMINGAVMGFAGPLRYILLTDALLESLPSVQVEAVLAHELGHVRRRHMLWLGAGALATVLLTAGAAKWAVETWAPAWERSAWVEGVITALGLGVALVAFGFVSRRFEWQADAFAVQHLSGQRPGGSPVAVSPEAVAAMSGALEAVARLNNIPRGRFTWRHGSIADRQARLAAMVGQRADRLAADRVARWVKVLAAAAVMGAAAMVIKTGVS